MLRHDRRRRSVAFGKENEDLADVRRSLRSSMDTHYLNALATRSISGKSRSFKGHSIENYAVKALLLDGCDFSDSTLTNVTFARSSLSGCLFSGASLQVCIETPWSTKHCIPYNFAALCDRGP